jgi:hypothetical protein
MAFRANLQIVSITLIFSTWEMVLQNINAMVKS